jgi:hypothetical protein
MARVDSQAPIGGVSTIFFGQTHIGVPSTAPMRAGRIAVDTVNGNTGFAVGNAGSSVNLTLKLQDKDGAGTQTVQPAVLNPLPGNGQLARFVTELGFTNSQNRADSSMAIEVNGAGTFVPLVLLERMGVFSSGAIARRTLFMASQYSGNYSGQWNNLTFGSTGGMTLSVTINSQTNSAGFTLDLNGSVFGGGDPPAETYSGNFTDAEFRSTSTSAVFGERLLVVRADGTMSLRAFDVPGSISWFTMDGQFTGTTMNGTYVVGFPGGTTANGTWNLAR